MSVLPAPSEQRPVWVPALTGNLSDRSPLLNATELAAVSELAGSRTRWPTDLSLALARLTKPMDDVLSVVTPQAVWWGRYPTRRALVVAMAGSADAFWGWDRERWVAVSRESDAQIRQIVMAVGYLLCEQRDLHLEFRGFKTRKFAGRVFGAGRVDQAIASVARHLDELGACAQLGRPTLQQALVDWMLLAASPLLEDLAARPDLLVWLRSREINNARRYGVEQFARTLVEMGVLERMPFATQPSREEWLKRSQAGEIDVRDEWLHWTRRWFETSTLSRSSRTHTYYGLIKAGRWLSKAHPDRVEPASWDRELAAEWVATVDRLLIGELSKSLNMRARFGLPLGHVPRRS